MSTIHETTVCIIGAGPAGASTSIFLGKEKISHVIVDAAQFPRDKVCGDGLDMRTIRVLNQIDPSIFPHEIMKHEGFLPCAGARLIHPSGKNSDFVFPVSQEQSYYYPYFTCKRFDFDHFLVKKIDKQYADLHLGTKVQHIEKTKDGWLLSATKGNEAIQIKCKLLVGADGDHSTVLKHLGERKINRQHYAGSVRQYWKGVAGMHPNHLIEFYLPPAYPFSYFWIFPLPNGEANVGYIMISQYAADNNYNIRKIFLELIATDPVLAPRFANATPTGDVAGWGLPLASLGRKAAGDGWLLVGDAASLISPTNGEGIGNSMLSGYVAAQFIKKAVAAKRYDEPMFTHYNREIYKSLQEEIDRYQFFMTKKPALASWIVNTLIQSNGFTRLLFKRMMKKWLHTAYEKKLVVDTK